MVIYSQLIDQPNHQSICQSISQSINHIIFTVTQAINITTRTFRRCQWRKIEKKNTKVFSWLWNDHKVLEQCIPRPARQQHVKLGVRQGKDRVVGADTESISSTRNTGNSTQWVVPGSRHAAAQTFRHQHGDLITYTLRDTWPVQYDSDDVDSQSAT